MGKNIRTKVRTHKGASKRFKITTTGKVLHRSHTIRHLRSAKSAKQIRRLKAMKPVTNKQAKTIKRLLGLA
ncbi:MAG: 50S ribosomal protein L35 [Candidatus Roizmanbacteria bacterium]|jgi:large subunit ribosomal protein L35